MQNFEVHHKIRQHETYSLFQGSTDDQQSIWIKIEKPHERLINNRSRLNGLRKSSPAFKSVLFEGEHDEHGWVTLFEDRDYQLSDSWLLKDPLPVDKFLNLANQLISMLSDLHDEGLMMNNLCAQAFAMGEDQVLYPIDLSKVTAIHEEIKLEEVSDSMAYRSPEQCQENRSAPDERSDLYSLGVLFYRMLVGELPFSATDPLELVHQIVASEPESPIELIHKLPLNLSNIIVKCIEKNPDNRYQSLWGLSYDLKHFQESKFELASKDSSPRLKAFPKLYGREKEQRVLDRVFKDTCLRSSNSVIISGYSGVGKTTIVEYLKTKVLEAQGESYFGKIDQFKKEQHYSPFVQIMNKMLLEAIELDHDDVEKLKAKLLEQVGEVHLALLQELIPSIKKFFNQSFLTTASVDLQDEQQRRRIAMMKLCIGLTQSEAPLLWFIDDLQWADDATIELFDELNREKMEAPFILVGSYRSNEVDSAHVLSEKVSDWKRSMVPVELKAFDLLTTANYLCDVLAKELVGIGPLSQVIFKKTEGNPFFVKIFLETLVQLKHLVFSHKQGWNWDIEAIKNVKTSENVVDVMVDRLMSFSKSVRSTLSVAACFGSSFPLSYQKFIREIDGEQGLIEDDLETCMSAGFLNMNDKEVIFAHDRIQEASYQLLSESQKQSFHAKIAAVLYYDLEKQNLLDQIFSIVDHYNLGEKMQEDPKLKKEGMLLNILAGEKAKRNSAFGIAQQYFGKAIQLVEEEKWETEHEVVVQLFREQIEVEYISGDVKASRNLVATLLSKISKPIERALCLNTLVYQYTSEGRYDEAIRAGQEGLGYLEYHLPLTNLRYAIRKDLKQLIQLLDGKGRQDLMDLPLMKNEETKTIQQLLMNIQPTAYMSNPELYNLLALRLALLNLEYGQTPETPKAFVTLGNVLYSSLEQPGLAKFFTDVWQEMDLVEADPRFRPRCKFIYIAFLHHWMAPMRQSYHHFLDGYQLGMDVGDYQYVGYLIGFGVSNLFNSSHALDELSVKIHDFQDFVSQQVQALPKDAVRAYQWAVNYLRAEDDYHMKEVGADLSFEFENRNFGRCNYYYLKSFCLMLDSQYEAALDWMTKADELKAYVKGASVYSEILVVKNLIKLKVNEYNEELEKEYLQDMKTLRLWEGSCVENFNFKRYLLEALWHAIKGEDILAMQAFDDAIEGASRFGFLQYEAIANESAADFWVKKGKDRFSKIYLADAYTAYKKWGCQIKQDQFKEKYVFAKEIFLEIDLEEVNDSRRANRDSLDLMSINKASRMISEELDLSQLTHRSLGLLMENAGAVKGALVFPDEKAWEIKVVALMQRGKVRYLKEGDYRSQEILPWKMMNTAARQRKFMAFNESYEAEGYEAYFQKQPVASSLVLPLVNQGEILALLYLENTKVSGVFVAKKIKSLELLATQVSISLTNANFFAALENKVESRTADLNKALAEVEYKNIQIEDSLHYAQSMQVALLPREESFKSFLSDYFVFWEPKDLVGGDIYFAKRVEDGFLIMLIDCTGHGVPGAFMTMIAGAAMEQIYQDENHHRPGELLQWLNRYVNDILQQGSYESLSDNGMDACLCFIPSDKSSVLFAGAKMDLLVHDGEAFSRIKGDKKSIGYRQSDVEFEFKTHRVPCDNHTFYMMSDGIVDQTGGKKGFSLGRKRIMEKLNSSMALDLKQQKESFINFFHEYQGDKTRLDDLSMLAFKVHETKTEEELEEYHAIKTELASEAFIGNVKTFLGVEERERLVMEMGEFNDAKLHQLTESIQGNLRDLKHSVKIIMVVIEQYQNIMRYSSIRVSKSLGEGVGMIMVSKDQDSVHCISVNPIKDQDLERLETLFQSYKGSDSDTLKTLYKERRQRGPDEFSKGGASLGLLEMFRKSSGDVDYKLMSSEQGVKLFCYRVRFKLA